MAEIDPRRPAAGGERTASGQDEARRRSRRIRWCGPILAALAALAAGPARAVDNEVYLTMHQMSPIVPSNNTFVYLPDGNINADDADPETAVGYLDGPELAVFDWNSTVQCQGGSQGCRCEAGVNQCAEISTSDDWRSDNGPTRPHWGTTTDGQNAATMYYVLRDAARSYFDTYNTIALSIQDVPNEDELVVMLNRPDSAGCSGSCMRPASDTDLGYRIFVTTRPNGSNGAVSYNDRPKIFYSPSPGGASDTTSVKVPVHEFGHYYNRVVAMKHGNGGGFDRHGPHQERALDEGLGYWYSSDYADTLQLRGGDCDTTVVQYRQLSDPSTDVHCLGNVITSALWGAQQGPGCDPDGWTTSVFSRVDSILGADFGPDDPFLDGSILRGFGWSVLGEARASNACDDTQARGVVRVYQSHEIAPLFVDQADAGSTRESGDHFGSALAAGDFDGDGRDDLAVGSPEEDEDGQRDSGFVHVLYGSPEGIVPGGFNKRQRLNQAFGGSTAERGDRFGAALAAADFNRDGYGDLAVASPDEDQNGEADSGFVHVFYGSQTGFSAENVARLAQETQGSTSERGDRFGFSLAAGDFNRDGFADLAVGVPKEDLAGGADAGFLIVFYGSGSGLVSGSYESFRQEDMASTSERGDRFAYSLAAGDFNGDDHDDLAAGAPYEDEDGRRDTGFLFVLSGSSSGLAPVASERINQATLGSTNETGDRFALSLAAGNLDGDEYDDLAIGGPYEDTRQRADAGFVWAAYGASTGLVSGRYARLDQEAGAGTSEKKDYFGLALQAADLDDDGDDELVVGTPGKDLSERDAGVVFTFQGPGLGAPTIRSESDFTTTLQRGADFGGALAAGDFDGDGTIGWAVAAKGRNRGAHVSQAGVVYPDD